MTGIGERMAEPFIVYRDGKPISVSGMPAPDQETIRRIEKRWKAWARWEAGEDVSNDELFGQAGDGEERRIE